MTTIADLREDGLISHLCQSLPTSKNTLIGPGDDCAVIDTGSPLTLLKTDAIVAGIHFLPEENPHRIGWKSVARVLSDFAAMGGHPGEFLITIALQKDTPLPWITDLYLGLTKCLHQFGGTIVGGETTSLPPGSPTLISISARGTVTQEHLTTRSGAKPDHSIYVTGTLGGSITAKHLDFSPRLPEAHWLCQNFKPSAMMDLSDGLAKDLPRLAKMSNVGFQLDPQSIPRSPGLSLQSALNDGEDYELLFTHPDPDPAALLQAWSQKFPTLPLTKIGQITKDPTDQLQGGWDHFQ